jgi:hypothetical protein
MKGYLFQIFLYLDILAQSLISRDPGLTISSRCGLALRNGFSWGWYQLGLLIETVAPGHCEESIRYDRERAEKVLELLK